MARRLVWIPVLPSVTVSEAWNFLDSTGGVLTRCWKLREGSQAPPATQAARCRNSRRFMGTSWRPQNRRLLLILDARKPRRLPGAETKGEKSQDSTRLKSGPCRSCRDAPSALTLCSDILHGSTAFRGANENKTRRRHKIFYPRHPPQVPGAKRARGPGLLHRAPAGNRWARLRSAER